MADSRSRREPRIDIDLDVTLQLAGDEFDFPVGDASYRGVFLITSDPLPLRKLVRIETQLADDEPPLQMMGLVAHHISPPEAEEMGRDPGMGIHLFSVGEETHRRWRDFVRERYDDDPEAREKFKRFEFPHIVAHLASNEELAEYFDEDRRNGEMFVRSSEVHDEGSSVICDIVHDQSDRALDLEGEVAGAVKSPPRKRGMTLEFSDLDDRDRRRVEAFIEGNFDEIDRRAPNDEQAAGTESSDPAASEQPAEAS